MEAPKTFKDIYPLTIVGDRYNGVYSGAKYTAWNQFFYRVPQEIEGSDPECTIFWREFIQGMPNGFMLEPVFVGFGNTTDEAINDLFNKMVNNKNEAE